VKSSSLFVSNFWGLLQHSLACFSKNPGFTISANRCLALASDQQTTAISSTFLDAVPYLTSSHLTLACTPHCLLLFLFLQSLPLRFPRQRVSSSALISKFFKWRHKTDAFQDVAAYDCGVPAQLPGASPIRWHAPCHGWILPPLLERVP